MSPSAETDIVPLDSLWSGSEKMVWDIIPAGNGFELPIGLYLCAALTVILIFSGKFQTSVSDFISHLPRPLPQSRSLSLQIALTFVLSALSCSLLTAGFLCHLSILPVRYLLRCASITVSALAVKTLLLNAIRAVSGQSCFLSFIRAMVFLLAAICIITMAFSITALLFPSAIGLKPVTHILAGMAAVAVIIYLYKISVTLFSAGISPFYSFLYLCTLEILPICLAASLFSRL